MGDLQTREFPRTIQSSPAEGVPARFLTFKMFCIWAWGLRPDAYRFVEWGGPGLHLRGRIHLPPVTSEMRTKAIAIQENTVWSVAMPMTKNASPRIRNMVEYLFSGRCLFMITIIHKEPHKMRGSKFNIQEYCHTVSLWNNKASDLLVTFHQCVFPAYLILMLNECMRKYRWRMIQWCDTL